MVGLKTVSQRLKRAEKLLGKGTLKLLLGGFGVHCGNQAFRVPIGRQPLP